MKPMKPARRGEKPKKLSVRMWAVKTGGVGDWMSASLLFRTRGVARRHRDAWSPKSSIIRVRVTEE